MKNKAEEGFKIEDYSHCLFRIPKAGGRALWEITNSCNYSCPYCIFSAKHGNIEGELTTDECFELIKGLKRNRFTHLKITGGEPFKRKDMAEILEKASELEFIVDISTNASYINKDIAGKIGKLNLQMVHVSLDGHNKEIHENARGPNTYKPTVKGIENLVGNEVYVRLGTVIFKENEDYIEETVQYAGKLGAKEIIFSYMEPVGRMKDNYQMISTKDMPSLKKELDELAVKYEGGVKVSYSFTEHAACEQGTCPAVDKFVYIDNLGKISPCTWVVEKFPEYRSTLTLKDASFEEIIDSKPICNFLTYVQNKKGCPVRRR